MIAISSLIISISIFIFLVGKIVNELILSDIFPLVPRKKNKSEIENLNKKIESLEEENKELKRQVKAKENKRTF